MTNESTVATPSQADEPATQTDARKPLIIKLAAVVVGLTVLVAVMLFSFAAPAVHSGPKHIPVGIAGPAAAVDAFKARANAAQPNALDLHSYPDANAVSNAIRDRKEMGGIVISREGLEIQTAAGAGTPYSTLLKGIGAGATASGAAVKYTELAPLTKQDPTASGLNALGLPLVFGGMLSAVALTTVLRGRHSMLRIAGSAMFSVLAGLAATTLLHSILHSIGGNFALEWLGISTGIAAISFTVLGLESHIGTIGFAAAGITMMFLANPLSAIATGPAWLPHPWGALGQLLPVGASGWVIRSLAFFDGRGATHGWVVLACWIVFGIVLSATGHYRTKHKNDVLAPE